MSGAAQESWEERDVAEHLASLSVNGHQPVTPELADQALE